MGLQIKLTENEDELRGIVILQQKNLKKNISLQEAEKEGFLTAEYDHDYLKLLHSYHPSVIAVDNGEVVGYALVAGKEVGLKHDLLADLILTVNKLEYKGQRLEDVNYTVVGQLCVAKEYRGQGLVPSMYHKFREELSKKFKYGITDIADSNARSLKAHLNAGFKVLDRLTYGGTGWNIVIWDWQE